MPMTLVMQELPTLPERTTVCSPSMVQTLVSSVIFFRSLFIFIVLTIIVSALLRFTPLVSSKIAFHFRSLLDITNTMTHFPNFLFDF